MLHIFVDADACPMKAEVYRVAERCALSVTIVANQYLRVPDAPWIDLQVVGDHPDAADDWIAEHVEAADICVTNDIPLAARCLEKDGFAIKPNGDPFTKQGIGMALANRELMQSLRETGAITGGPRPFNKSDRSAFLNRLEVMVQTAKRAASNT